MKTGFKHQSILSERDLNLLELLIDAQKLQGDMRELKAVIYDPKEQQK